VSTTPKVPLKLQSVHFQNFLSIISTPNTSFKTKIRRHDMRCKKKKHRKFFLCSWKISFMTHSQVTGWNTLEGFTKSSCGKWNLVARSRLPTLERGRGSSWEPRD
jgi:hypothetical protein